MKETCRLAHINLPRQHPQLGPTWVCLGLNITKLKRYLIIITVFQHLICRMGPGWALCGLAYPAGGSAVSNITELKIVVLFVGIIRPCNMF